MKKASIFALAAMFVFSSLAGVAYAMDEEGSDLAVFASCFFETAEGDCAKADFNGDGFIDFVDLGLIGGALQFDLNGDGEVTFDYDEDSDLTAFANCFFQTAEGDCAKADFNGDGFVDFVDLGLFGSALQFDLNGDGEVTFDLEDEEE